MSSLVVIRHGQASYGAANYDELSSLGHAQSEKLGEYLAGQGREIDAIYVGPKKRHEQTCAALRRGAVRAGFALPEPIRANALDEFPAFELFRMHYPVDGDSSDAVVTGDAMDKFPALCLSWMKGELDSGDLESAEEFESRVSECLLDIAKQQGEGKRVLVITSGGPMMVAMKQALALDAYNACQLLWVTANTALSEFRCTQEKLLLHTFNALSHLPDKDLSYR